MALTRIDPEMTTGLVKTDDKAPVDGETAGEAGDVVALNSGLKVDYNHLPVGTAENNLIQLGSGGKIATDRLDTGTSEGQIVEVQSGGQLPALDGTLLTNISSVSVTSGQVIKIAHAQLTANVTTTLPVGSLHSVQDADIAGMAVTLTSPLAASKVKIEVSWCGEPAHIHAKSNHIFLLKKTISGATTELANTQGSLGDPNYQPVGIMPAVGDLAYNTTSLQSCSFTYWDVAGTTDAITYKLVYRVLYNAAAISGSNLYTNRTVLDDNTSGAGKARERGVSSITVTEVKA